MGRSGYCDDLDPLALGQWRGRVASAMRGKRGQQFLRDLVAALDAMPDKRLIANDLEHEGEYCALGAVGKLRGVDLSKLDVEKPDMLGSAFNIASCMAQEVEFINDDDFAYSYHGETPEERWQRVRRWAIDNIEEERK